MAAALYNMALRHASSIQSDLARLESESPSSSTSVALQGQISASLSSFHRTVEDYESMSRRESNETKRDKALGRVKKFREDEKTMRSNFARVKSRDPASWTANEGAGTNGAYASTSGSSARPTTSAHLESPFSLHARNSTAAGNGQSPYSQPYVQSPYQQQQQQQQADPLAAYKMNASAQAMFGSSGSGGGGDNPYSAREGHALREHSFIQNTEQQLDAFIAQGREVWGNLTEQRDILKGTQRRLLDAANTLGLSRTVINAVERRSTQDNVIFACGCIFTLVCFCELVQATLCTADRRADSACTRTNRLHLQVVRLRRGVRCDQSRIMYIHRKYHLFLLLRECGSDLIEITPRVKRSDLTQGAPHGCSAVRQPPSPSPSCCFPSPSSSAGGTRDNRDIGRGLPSRCQPRAW